MIPNRIHLGRILLVSGLILGGCAPAPEPAIAPPPEVAGVKIQMWTHSPPGRSVQEVFAKNYTDRPLQITFFRLYNCVNLRQECTASNPGLTLQPGAVALVARLEPAQATRPFSFRYDYQWHQGPQGANAPE